MLKFICNYGPFKRDMEVNSISKGRDFYVIRYKGTPYNVPENVVSKVSISER